MHECKPKLDCKYAQMHALSIIEIRNDSKIGIKRRKVKTDDS